MLPFSNTFFKDGTLHEENNIFYGGLNGKVNLKRPNPTAVPATRVEKVRVLHLPDMPNNDFQYLSFVDDLEASESRLNEKHRFQQNFKTDTGVLNTYFPWKCKASGSVTKRHHFLVKGREMKAFFRLLGKFPKNW